MNRIRINLGERFKFPEHRSGWDFAVQALAPLHNIHGVFLDAFLERSHSWELEQQTKAGLVPYIHPWVGFIHNPPNMPGWFDYHNSPQVILKREIFQASLANCKGILTLSNYLRDWLVQQPCLKKIPVSSLIHPTEIPKTKFTMPYWQGNKTKKIIALGYWLRRMYSIQQLPTKRYLKVWLVTSDYAKECRDLREHRTMDTWNIRVGTYQEWKWVDNRTYDQLLAQNIAFVHLYDASACNSIIECIVRNTPLLVNPIPSVREYLGEEYPFYFETLEEAAAKAEDQNLIKRTHEYLRDRDKTMFTQAHFRETFISSEVGNHIADSVTYSC